jgi:alkylation response protein AidB-like acyl-CoA dehydrogenase
VNFDFGPASRQYQEEARAFLARELTPERVAEMDSDGVSYHPGFHRALTEQGWLAPGWPVEYGGRGLDPLDVVAFQEELAEAGAPTYAAATTMMVAGVIREVGTGQQKAGNPAARAWRRDHHRARLHRAWLRLRRGRRDYPRRPRRRRLGDQRAEDVHHERAGRRLHLPARPDRPGRAEA